MSQNLETPFLSIILVNHNARLHLESCLRSLREHPASIATEIIVVDNASTDGSRDVIASAGRGVRRIFNQENLGFARANNLGVDASRGKFILFLNTDTVVGKGALDRLCSRLQSHPEAGAVGPALFRDEENPQVSFGNRVDFFAQWRQKVIWNPYHARRLKTDRRPRKVGWLSGACLLVRREVFSRVGGFDENFFLYFEDIDLCYRIRRSGRRLLFFPDIRILHSGGGSTAPQARFCRFQYRKSQLYFYRKHNSGLSLRLLRVYLRLWLILNASGRKADPSAPTRDEWRQLVKK